MDNFNFSGLVYLYEKSFMQTQAQEKELMHYWQQLTSVQKDLVVGVIKNFVGEEVEKQEPVAVPKEVMNEIWKDREDYKKGVGQTYSRKEARAYVLRNAARK